MARASGTPPPTGGSWLTLRLDRQEPFDAAALLAFLAARAIPGVEQVTGNRYSRTVRTPGGPGLVELTLPGEAPPPNGRRHVLLRARLPGRSGAGPVVSRCRQLLDLDADPATIAAVLAADDILAPLVRARPGLRVPGAYDGFELAVRAVMGQQVSVAAASTLAGRLAARFGTRVDGIRVEGTQVEGTQVEGTRVEGTRVDGTRADGPAGSPSLVFPAPADLAETDLSGLGLTGARQATLRALAAAVASGRLGLDRGADREETAARLAELRGIGPWTVSYILMRAVGDRDAFPSTDLGLRRALGALGCPVSRAERWRPWRAYAAVHLWTWHAVDGR